MISFRFPVRISSHSQHSFSDSLNVQTCWSEQLFTWRTGAGGVVWEDIYVVPKVLALFAVASLNASLLNTPVVAPTQLDSVLSCLLIDSWLSAFSHIDELPVL